ncbi:MAG: patatin-like phospholipase family protein, partial [Leptospira sp.]|nr:patatin-like phospholipase family protein [Leptospira sp.]
MKKALILSGGGARGAYQAGVIKYLEQNGFVPD